MYTFITDKIDTPFGGWSRRVKIGEQEYAIAVKRDKSVRIPYKPRGQNRGWTYRGTVYRMGGDRDRLVWAARSLARSAARAC